MASIKKSLLGVSGAVMIALLSTPSVSFGMEVDKENTNRSPNKSITEEKSTKKLSEKELEFKKYVDEHRDAMKQASKAVSKKLKLNPPKSKKHQK